MLTGQNIEDYVLKCKRARADNKPQPEAHTFNREMVKSGFRIQTVVAMYKRLNRFREKDAIPEARDIILALIPWAWEMINRHMPRSMQANEDADKGVEDRPWREWDTDEA